MKKSKMGNKGGGDCPNKGGSAQGGSQKALNTPRATTHRGSMRGR